MFDFLKKIKDPRLESVIDSVELGDAKQFKKIQKQFPEYDISFLWLLSYPKEGALISRKYIENGYKKFHQILDSNFPKILVSKGNFESRMWELVLCDTLSASGELIPKGAAGADLILKGHDEQEVQIEAVAPDESDNEELRSVKPDYTTGNIFQFSGNIEDMERPILLRVFDKGFKEKAERKKYESNKPLIVAINSSKTVGMTSLDEYVLRRILFGLGFNTITRTNDAYINGLQQNPLLNKPGMEGFEVAVFRNPKYKHISGVIYTSQRPIGFVPGGYSWGNSGITFVPNPLASHPINLQFPFFKKLLCNEEKYQEIGAEQQFQSSIDLS